MHTSWYHVQYLKTVRAWAHELQWKFFRNGPPYDPFTAAAKLGVQISQIDLNGVDGYVEAKGDSYCIFLSSRASKSRQRFTLAHELAHVFLMNVAKRNGFYDSYLIRYRNNGLPRSDIQDKNEEHLCNAFAQEFLLPTEDIRARVSYKNLAPLHIIQIASEFQVSLQAVAVKLTRLFRTSHIVCSLWNLKTPWPVAAWWAGEKTLTKTDISILEELAKMCISERKELTEIWGPQGKRRFELRVRIAPTNSQEHAIAVLSPFRGSRNPAPSAWCARPISEDAKQLSLFP